MRGVSTVVGLRRSKLDGLGLLRRGAGPGGLFAVLFSQETEFKKVYFDSGRLTFLIVGFKVGRVTARQRGVGAVRHGQVC